MKKLGELKAAAERAILAKLPSLERYAYDLMVEFVDANLDTVNGKLVPNEAALRALNSFVDQYLGAFTQSQAYQGNVAAFLKNFKDVGTLAVDFQADRGFDVEKAKVGEVQALVQNEIIDQYGENGLNSGFAQPLRELLYNNVSGGLDKKQAMAQLRDYIESGKDTTGKLHRYLEQTAQQGVDSYTGAINTRIMQTFKINTMIMSGSLIKTSSPQCRFCITKLGGIIDRADWPAVVDIAKNEGLIDGTTFDNLPFNRLHWGCRHEFTPAVLSDAERSQISKPTNE